MKISRFEHGEEVPAFERDAYELNRSDSGTQRVLVRCVADPVGFLLGLLGNAPGPVGLLYVLLLSRTGKHQPGRYQSPYVSAADAEKFPAFP